MHHALLSISGVTILNSYFPFLCLKNSCPSFKPHVKLGSPSQNFPQLHCSELASCSLLCAPTAPCPHPALSLDTLYDNHAFICVSVNITSFLNFFLVLVSTTKLTPRMYSLNVGMNTIAFCSLRMF